jgi:hypothetical protein
MIQKMRAKVVWVGLFVVIASLFTSLAPVQNASAASNYNWNGSSQIVSAQPPETYNPIACSGYDQAGGTCGIYNFGFKGAHPSNCTIDKIPDQFGDAAWPADVLKIIQVKDDGTGSSVDTSAPLATLLTITGASGTTCNTSVTNITLNSGATSSQQADYAYTDPNTIRNIHNGNTFKITSDKTVYNEQYGTDSATCPDYIKLPSAGATTGVWNIPTDIHGSTCEYNNVPNNDNISGPVKITISKTVPNNIPTDPHAKDVASVDSCTIPSETTMRWLVCAFVSLGQGTIELVDRIIQDLLFVPTDQIFTPEFKTAWNSFRVVGVILVLLAGLVMIISQAAGLELFDAYTIKKLLPRLLVAAIGISLSWPLMQLTVTFFNDIGGWAHDLILYPFGNLDNHAVGSTYLGALLLIGALPAVYLILGPFGSILLLGTIALAVLVGLLVLTLRQIIIIMAVLMAPLAIAAYVLPGTQKLWAFWKNTFLTSLLMFPIIMGFIAAGQALALVAAAVKDSPMMHLLSVLAYIAPYFLLPFAFKLAGGLMSTIFSIANDRNKGAFDRLKKARAGAGAQHRQHTIGQRSLQARASLERGALARASRSGRFRGALLRGAAHGVGGYNLEARMSALNAQTGKELGDQIATGDDTSIRGASVSLKAANADAMNATADADGYTYSANRLRRVNDKGAREYQTLGGAWVDEGNVLAGHRRWGNNVAAQQAVVSYEMRKAMTDEQVAGISKRYRTLAQEEYGLTDTQAGGNWIGAAFENQNTHLEFKNTNWKDGQLKDGGKALAREAFEKKGSYQLSQMSGHTIDQLMKAYDGGDAETKRMVRAVSETFMSRYGSGMGRGVGGEGDEVAAQMAAQQQAAAAAAGTPGAAGAGGNWQTNSPGAAAVAEKVRELALKTGVYGPDLNPKPQSSPRESTPDQN